jgi:hypothetical protein
VHRHSLYIDGKPTDAAGGDTFTSDEPAAGTPLAEL